MKTNLNAADFELEDDKPTRKPRPKKPKARTEYLGKLHILLTKGLPDMVDEQGILDTRALAKYLGISYQALYKWFEREQIPPKRIGGILVLSKKQKKHEGFSPLVRDDFWEFMSR